MPNNRELAIVVWLIGFLLWQLRRAEIRAQLSSLHRQVVQPKILVPIGVLLAWTATMIYGGARIGLWHPELVTATFLWFVTSGLVLFGNFNHAAEQGRFFRRKALAVFEIGIVVQVFADLFVLALPLELVLQPLLFLLAVASVVGTMKDEHRQAKLLIDGVLVTTGIGLLAYVTTQLVANWGDLDHLGVLLRFAMPVWLTLGLLPYVYALGLYAAYETAFLPLRMKDRPSWWSRVRSRAALMASLHVRAHDVGVFSGSWRWQLARASSFRDALGVVRDFRADRLRREAAATAEREQLIRHAGSDGVDERGRRLDRREFAETTAALNWLATCQMGWHRRGGYRADLLEVLGDDFSRFGLSSPSGIKMVVSADGDAWYAWRRTVAGWVFAVGADAPPPNRWEYDGPEPPEDFPGKDATWGTAPFALEFSVNWQ